MSDDAVFARLKGWRKVLMFALVFGVASVMLWFSKIGAADWVQIAQWSFGFLVAGNIGEHIAEARK